MKRKARKNRNKNIGKVMTGLLLGGVVGAAIGWLTAPSSGEEMRRRLRGEMMSAREKAKTAVENVESKARELASEMNENVAAMGESTPRRRKVTSIGS
jgi:gas vesicle protein